MCFGLACTSVHARFCSDEQELEIKEDERNKWLDNVYRFSGKKNPGL